MVLPSIAIVSGLALLIWSANKFVDGSAELARKYSVPPLLIGIVIIGFGTSFPEMMVSAFAAYEGNSGLALGNAYGSNIANIALIIGVTAVIAPIAVHSDAIRREIPILLGVTGLTVALLFDGALSRIDAVVLFAVFLALIGWSVREGFRNREDSFGQEVEAHYSPPADSAGKPLFRAIAGLVVLIVSSRLLVWGAVEVAGALGVSDLLIGLTIVAVGTSLPELASSLSAALKKQPDLALGNILGSNLFNTLVVVGIAGIIEPMIVPPEILSRDIIVVGLATVLLFVFCFSFRGQGQVTRPKGAILLFTYIGYNIWLIA
ncbi:MAG: calcium/sodium antiporter [Alphaproteobacteria bacterium]